MKKLLIVIFIASMMVASCGNSKEEKSDAAMDIALKNIQLDELREKNEELKSEIEELKKENESLKKAVPDYEIATIPFMFEYDKDNVITVEYKINATLNKTFLVGESTYSEGNENLMEADLVVILGYVVDKINSFEMINYIATVGEKKYYYTFYDGEVKINDIISESPEGVPDKYAANYAILYAEFGEYIKSVGIK